MNGANSIIALVVAVLTIIFVGKLILRRVGRPVTKVYNTVAPPAVYMQPPTYFPTPVYYPADGYPQNQMPAPPQENPAQAEPETEDELFDDIVRNYDKP